MSLTLETLDNSSTDQHSAIKSKILNCIDKRRQNKKRADLNAITKHIIKTKASNLDQGYQTIISELLTKIQLKTEGLQKALTPFGWFYLFYQNKSQFLVVPYMEDILMFPHSPSDLLKAYSWCWIHLIVYTGNLFRRILLAFFFFWFTTLLYIFDVK